MYDNAHPQFFKPSDKTVNSFIRKDNEQNIKDFFLRDIDEKLKVYEPGEPKNKPDVLEQIKEIENKREVMIKEEMVNQKKMFYPDYCRIFKMMYYIHCRKKIFQ